MAKLVNLKSLNNLPNAVEINSSFGVPSNTEIYRVDKTYVQGDRVLYLNQYTNQYDVYKCVTTASGSWTPAFWKIDNVDQEINEAHQLRDELLAEVVRGQTNSGIMDFIALSKTGASLYGLNSTIIDTNGAVQVATSISAHYPNYKNFFATNPFFAIVDGYKLLISQKEQIPGVTTPWNPIQLSEPPINGYRDDLVFLEAWFEETSSRLAATNNRRRKMKYRIRVVDGADFVNFPVGLGYSDLYNNNVAPQGGNAAPITPSISTRAYSQFASYALRRALGPDDRISENDFNLFVAGRGTENATVLQSASGYVYALPLFRVKRRNKADYSLTNPNGSREYLAWTDIFVDNAPFNSVNDLQSSNGSIKVAVKSWAAMAKVRIGDEWRYGGTTPQSSTGFYGRVVAKSATTLEITLEVSRDAFGTLQNVYTFFPAQDGSHRPDKKFSNIVYTDDIIDLRRSTSLTGVDYDKILKENFDKFLRGELTSDVKRETQTERFGLRRITVPESKDVLQATRVVTSEGPKVLTNLLGLKGGFYKSLGKISDYSTISEPITSYDYTDIQQMNSSRRWLWLKTSVRAAGVNWSNRVYFNAACQPGKYYIFVADVYLPPAGKAIMTVFDTAIGNVYAQTNVVDGTGSYVVKFTSDALNPLTTAVGIYNGKIDDSPSVRFSNVRVYQISKAEYDVLPTDRDVVASRFPYVDSLPLHVKSYYLKENFTSHFNATRTTGEQTESVVEKNIPVLPNTKYKVGSTFLAGTLKMTVFTHQQETSATVHNSIYTSTMGQGAGYEYTNSNGSSFMVVTTGPNDNFMSITTGNIPAGSYTSPIQYGNVFVQEFNDVTIPVSKGLYELSSSLYVEDGRVSDFVNHQQKRTYSYSIGVDSVTELIEPLNTPQSNVTVTQATKGTWAINDTIKIKATTGFLNGQYDSDTAKFVVTAPLGDISPGDYYVSVDEIPASIAVNDIFKLVRLNTITTSTYDYKVVEIDTVNKRIKLNVPGATSIQDGHTFIEYAANNSVPTHTISRTDGASSSSAGVTFTWTGMGTQELIGTVTAITTEYNRGIVKLSYSVVYPPGNGFKYVPEEVLEVKVNGEKYIKSSNKVVTSVANFTNKAALDTRTNPNFAIPNFTSNISTVTPVISTGHSDQGFYTKLAVNDALSAITTRTVTGEIAFHQYTFNVIEHLQRLYGTIPGGTLSEKVTWARTYVAKLVGTVVGASPGSSASKLTLGAWKHDSSVWWYPFGSGNINTTATNSKIVFALSPSAYSGDKMFIDNNGYVHFIVYSDPAAEGFPSTVQVSYVELQIEVLMGVETTTAVGDGTQSDSNYELYVPERQNVNFTENILFMSQANMLDNSSSSVTPHGVSQISFTSNQSISFTSSSGSGVRWQVPAQPVGSYTFSIDAKIEKDKRALIHFFDPEGQTTVGHSSIVGTGEWVRYSTTVYNKPVQIVYLITNESSDITIECARPKLEQGINVNPVWSPGRKSTIIFNVVNKRTGDTVTNPHRMLIRTSSTFANVYPKTTSGDFLEYTNSQYETASIKNDKINYWTALGNGFYAISVSEFDFSHLQLSRSELLKALKKTTFTVAAIAKGYNAGVVSTNITVSVFNYDTLTWSSSNDLISSMNGVTKDLTGAFDAYMSSDMKMSFMVRPTYPTNETEYSELNLNYTSLTVYLSEYLDIVKHNVVKIRKDTKELKLHFPKKSFISGQEDVVDVTYSYNSSVPFEVNSVENITMLAELGYVFASDLSSFSGANQGTHHYKNPLYKLGIDSLQAYGEFGFAEIPVAVDSKNTHVGLSLQLTALGLANGYTTQYGINAIKKPMVYTFAYLVLHYGELKLLLISRHTTTGDIVQKPQTSNKVLMVPLDGHPTIKDLPGVTRNTMGVPTPWKTPIGEILGYLNDRGDVIVK